MAYIMRPVQDSYGCGRCPSVAPFVGQKSYTGVSGIYARRLGSLGAAAACAGRTISASTTLAVTQRVRAYVQAYVRATSGPSFVPTVPGMRFVYLVSSRDVLRDEDGGGLVVDMVIEFALTSRMSSRTALSRIRAGVRSAASATLGASSLSVLCNGDWLRTANVAGPVASAMLAQARRDYPAPSPSPTPSPGGGGGGGGGGSTPTPTPSPTERPLAASEGIPLWGWIGIGLAAGAVVIGATAAVASRSQALSGLSLMGFGR